ncbi:hypothetical protein DW074_05995 [Ruminococcus sp. AF46-10NS]|nr:alpha-L-rhamnosidase [Ruminococcus sp. AF46-10NS]RHK24721.1 hypothetical protein DW074_05995 [Ruminococcus sp. AF46-10NS]
MRIKNVRINGMENPTGFDFGTVCISWKVREASGKEQQNVKIEVSLTESFEEVLCVKEGKELNSAAEKLEFQQNAHTRYYVKVTVTDDKGETAVSEPAYFETGKMEEPWVGKWITTEKEDTFHPLFVKSFEAKKGLASARLYICGLGLFTAELNGKKVGDEVLTPYYSNYHDEEQYITFDITEDVKEQNELRVSLGNGWFKGKFGLNNQSNNFGDEFKLIAELRLVYEDGEVQVIGTDETWEYIGSDVEDDGIYDGEIINHLLWKEKENLPKKAVLTEAEGKLVARYSLPVMEMEDMPVKEVIYTPLGETVLDFGQNFAGYVTFRNHLLEGTRIVFDHGEILQDGNFYNENYRSAKSQFVYVSDGRDELVRPSFTYFGFRYVRVTGWPGEAKEEDFTGKALYSKMDRTGYIETGHQGVNRLFLNALWGQKSNFIDFPTDCPQRDERLGWTGDAQVFSGTASFNMDTTAFYHKFLHDLRNEQVKYDGILPGVIPVLDPNGPIFSSVWGDIATILPMVVYEHSGNVETLRENYPMMKDWVDKITKEDKARGQKYLYDFGNQLGDWLALDGRTEQSMEGGTDAYYIGSNYYAMSVQKTATAAEILGYKEDEAYYKDLYEKIKDAIIREYFTETGRLAIDSQTGYIVALYSGIYRDKEAVVAGLKARFYKDCYKLKGGFTGAPILCRVLAENGFEEDAFYFLMQEEYPGWMHCINLGATTIWERWNSVLDDGHLSGTMMNSLNHYSYGAIVEYLYRDVAGLKALEPGFKKALITPLMNGKLKYMNMTYDSAYGEYKVSWKVLKDGNVSVDIQVPFGCSAVIGLPFYEGEVTEVAAGSYHYEYRPTEDLRQRYNHKTMFKDMMHDPEAMKVIERVSPMLMYFLSTGNQDYFYESLQSLEKLSYMASPERS